MMTRHGFTLMEILIVLVIVGVMSSLAIPIYNSTTENSRANEAAVNLNTIYMGQKMYFTDHATYYPSSGSQSDLATINTNLSTDLQTNFYNLSITGGTNTFTATATRTSASGGDTSYNITINQSGCFGGSPASIVPANTRPGC